MVVPYRTLRARVALVLAALVLAGCGSVEGSDGATSEDSPDSEESPVPWEPPFEEPGVHVGRYSHGTQGPVDETGLGVSVFSVTADDAFVGFYVEGEDPDDELGTVSGPVGTEEEIGDYIVTIEEIDAESTPATVTLSFRPLDE